MEGSPINMPEKTSLGFGCFYFGLPTRPSDTNDLNAADKEYIEALRRFGTLYRRFRAFDRYASICPRCASALSPSGSDPLWLPIPLCTIARSQGSPSSAKSSSPSACKERYTSQLLASHCRPNG